MNLDKGIEDLLITLYIGNDPDTQFDNLMSYSLDVGWIFNDKSKYKSEIKYLGTYQRNGRTIEVLEIDQFNQGGNMKLKLTEEAEQHIKHILRQRNIENIL